MLQRQNWEVVEHVGLPVLVAQEIIKELELAVSALYLAQLFRPERAPHGVLRVGAERVRDLGEAGDGDAQLVHLKDLIRKQLEIKFFAALLRLRDLALDRDLLLRLERAVLHDDVAELRVLHALSPGRRLLQGVVQLDIHPLLLIGNGMLRDDRGVQHGVVVEISGQLGSLIYLVYRVLLVLLVLLFHLVLLVHLP